MTDWWEAAPLADAPSAPAARGSGKWWESAPVVDEARPKRDVPDAVRPFVGANRAIASMAGAPVDAATWAINNAPGTLLVNKGASALGFKPPIPKIENPIGGSESIKTAMGALPAGGANPDDVTPAATTGQKLLEEAGSGAASMLVPGLGAEAVLARTMKEGEAFGQFALNILKGTGPASNAVMGAAGGVGGEVAAEQAPDWLKPTARLLGGVLGGVGGAVAETAVRGTGRAVGTIAGDAVRAATEAPEMRAGRTILARSEDPAAFRRNVAEAADAPPLVANSESTTFQATGDLGVGGLERDVAARNNENAARFAERRTDQNTARLKELDTLVDPAADPAAVTDYAKSGHQALTDYHTGQVAAATARQEEQAAAHLTALGRLADPAADSAAVTDYVRTRLQGLTDDHAARVATAAQGVAEGLARAGGASFDNPAAYGEALRTPLAALNQRARDAERALWRAIDPDMSAPVGAGLLKRFATETMESLPSTAKAPEGEEASILAAIRGLGETTDFGSMVALRARLTDAIRDERRNGTPTVLRRLTMLLENVDGTLATTAGEIASDPARRQAVVTSLQREASTWQSTAANEQRAGAEAGGGVRLRDEGLAPAQEGGVPPASGGEVEARGPSGASAGNQGLQEAPRPVEAIWSRDGRDVPVQIIGEPPVTVEGRSYQKIIHDGQEGYLPADEVSAVGITPDVADRYAAARAATRERAGTYRNGSVGGVLAEGAERGSFKMTASNVPKNLFDTPERLDAFVAAAKGDPAALAPMRDYAAFSLRQAAVKDGMLSPAKYQQWMDDHGYALRQFPELRERFANVRAAQATLDETLGAQKQALAEYQTGSVRRLLDGQDPVQVAGAALSNSAQFDSLVAQVKGDPAALAGLKRATMDYMVGRALNTSGGTSQVNVNALQKLYLQNRKTLSSLFDGAELANMERVTVEMQRASNDAASVVENALGTQKQTLTDYQTGVLKRFLQGEDPAKAAGKALGNPENLKQLVAEVGKDPEAFAGLKRAMVDFIMSKAKGTAEAGTSELPQINAATLQNLYVNNRRTLLNSGLFTRTELDSLERVTVDLQRANRSIVAVKIPGGSNTAQDTGSRAMSALRYMVQHGGKVAGAAIGGSTSGPLGAGIGAVGGAAVDAMVAARMNSIDKATVELMLDPKMAAAWIEKIPIEPSRNLGDAFARKMRALTANQVMHAIDEENRR